MAATGPGQLSRLHHPTNRGVFPSRIPDFPHYRDSEPSTRPLERRRKTPEAVETKITDLIEEAQRLTGSVSPLSAEGARH